MTIKVDEHGLTVQASRPALAYVLAFTGVNLQSPTFAVKPPTPYLSDGTTNLNNQNTNHIRLVSTVPCWIAFGTNPTAAVGGPGCIMLAPLVPEYFWVYPGERIAVVQDTAGGVLNVAELVS